MTSKPSSFIFLKIILGGGAPAVNTLTFLFNFFLSESGAPVIIFKTIGAPPK